MTYKTFKQLITDLAKVRSKDDLYRLMSDVDMSYQHDKITYKDNEIIYEIINNVVKREYID
jgi:hypothetical protein